MYCINQDVSQLSSSADEPSSTIGQQRQQLDRCRWYPTRLLLPLLRMKQLALEGQAVRPTSDKAGKLVDSLD
jgi:hypothetical protein